MQSLQVCCKNCFHKCKQSQIVAKKRKKKHENEQIKEQIKHIQRYDVSKAIGSRNGELNQVIQSILQIIAEHNLSYKELVTVIEREEELAYYTILNTQLKYAERLTSPQQENRNSQS